MEYLKESHTKTMTRTREDGKEEVFSACIKAAGSGYFRSDLVRSDSHATVGFFTIVKLD